MNKKNVFLWTLYDFANSIVSIVFFLYFSQWLVVEKGVADLWYNMIFAIGSVILLLTAPILGSVADKTGKDQSYFNKITVLSFASFVAVSFITLFFSHEVFLAALFFLLANYFYQFSFVFYNAFLHHIAPREKWGRVSGIGIGANYIGQIVGLLITLPLAGGTIYLIGEVGRAQTFLPATVLFIALALPMLLFFKLNNQQNNQVKVNLIEEYKSFFFRFKELIKVPSVGLFLLAFFFFNDALITTSNNFPIYLENVYGVSDKVKSMLLVGILITSAIGALVSGFIADKIGLKKTLDFVLGSWIVIFPLLAIAPNFIVFVVFTVLMGLMFGATWAVSRAAMTALCPPDKLSFGFSFYTLAERASTLVGPLAWGLITFLLVNLGATRYKIATIAMAGFVAIGIFFLRKVEIKES